MWQKYPTLKNYLHSNLYRVLSSASKASFIILTKDSKILLGKRSSDGSYTFPGGKFDAGENKTDAVLRELKEETGIELNKEDIQFIASNEMESEDESKTIYVFTAEISQDPEVTSKKEIKKWKWVKHKKLAEYLKDSHSHDQWILKLIEDKKVQAGQLPDHDKSGNELGISDDKGKPKFSPDFSQEEMATYVKDKSDHIPETGFAIGKPTDFEWSFIPEFELAQVTPIKTDWVGWYDGEWSEWVHDHGDERSGHFEKWADNPAKKPPILIEGTDGKLHIWDGHHRIGIAHKLKMENIPVLLGKPKKE
jgi:ADP-ribose pyrophosphatase YjhB (NUDIX family)